MFPFLGSLYKTSLFHPYSKIKYWQCLVFIFSFFICIYLCVCVLYACTYTSVDKVCALLPPCESPGSNLSHQVLLPTEPSHWPGRAYFVFIIIISLHLESVCVRAFT